MPITRLRCLARTTPHGVDGTGLALSWNGLPPGAPWRLRIASADGGVAWDSGVRHEPGPARPPALPASRPYTWQVCDVAADVWSQPSRFITGQGAEDWQAAWIGHRAQPRLRYPWPELQAVAVVGEPFADLGESFYRLAFTVADPAAIPWATLRLLSGATSVVHLNGRQIRRCAHWLGAYDLDVAHHLKAGRNVLAVQTIDKEHGRTALAAVLHLGRPDGTVQTLATGSETWRAQTRQAPAEWTQVWFDDRTWAMAEPVGVELPGKRPDPGHAPVQLKGVCRLPEGLRSAVAHLACVGVGELRVNGRLLDSTRMDGGWTDARRRAEVRTFDALPALVAGDNAIEITLAGGWWQLHDDAGEPPLQASFELVWTDHSGREGRFGSGPDWQARAAPIAMSSLYHGEITTCDQAEPWQPATPGDWQAPRLPALADPIAEIERLAPVSLTRTRHGSVVADFGQNVAGFIDLRGRFGNRVTVQHSELLGGDGLPLLDNLRTARQIAIYHLGTAQPPVLRPVFALSGFRYAEIFGWEGGVEDLAAVVVHTRLEASGSFTCSEPLLDRIFTATRWTFRDNFHAVPSDCPQRDERLGWMADAGNVPEVAAQFYDIERFFDKWAVDMQDAQACSGFFPNFAPDISRAGSGYGGTRGTPGWADAGVRVPWALYQRYGDLGRLADHYPAMRRHVETMRADSQDDLYERGGWGDWLATEPTPGEPIGTAYFHDSTRLVAEAAAALGHAEDAACYRALCARIATAFHARHFDHVRGCYGNGSQTMQAMALALGLVPAGCRAQVLARLEADIAAHEDHLTTGFLGTTFAVQALAEAGCHDLLLRILTRRDFPSLGRILDLGSTTITEAWNAHLGVDFASHNHFNLGAVCSWFFGSLAGIRGAAPGMASLDIAPAFPSGLERVEATQIIPAGTVAVHWWRQAEVVELAIELPVPGKVVMPPGYTADRCGTLPPGQHRLAVRRSGQN